MKIHLIALTAVCLVSGAAQAAEDRRSPENRQAYCELEMRAMKDEDARKAQVADCIRQSEVAHDKKAKMCESSAKGRKPEDRQAYLADCMKK